MDYKEKYEEALETVQEILNSGADSIMMSRLKLRLQSVFPELKESEDEKIRKEILNYCKDKAKLYPNDPKYNNISAWIAWLEKQAEQKPNWSDEDERLRDVVEYVYILDYCIGRVIVAKHDLKESIESLFNKLGLKESQCQYMVSSNILSIEYINF